MGLGEPLQLRLSFRWRDHEEHSICEHSIDSPPSKPCSIHDSICGHDENATTQSEGHARASELDHSVEEKVSGTPFNANEGTTCTKLRDGAELQDFVDEAVSSQ